jgi:hypothetical protein
LPAALDLLPDGNGVSYRLIDNTVQVVATLTAKVILRVGSMAAKAANQPSIDAAARPFPDVFRGRWARLRSMTSA